MSDIPPWTRATTKNTMEWRVKIGKTSRNNGSIMVGVAVKGTSLNDGTYVPYKDGMFLFNLYKSLLYSGAPFNFKGVEYGPRKEAGCYAKDGDFVGITLDMDSGNLSFSVNGENMGVAFKGIPVDKPLLPCVVYLDSGDSAEILWTSERAKRKKKRRRKVKIKQKQISNNTEPITNNN